MYLEGESNMSTPWVNMSTCYSLGHHEKSLQNARSSKQCEVLWGYGNRKSKRLPPTCRENPAKTFVLLTRVKGTRNWRIGTNFCLNPFTISIITQKNLIHWEKGYKHHCPKGTGENYCSWRRKQDKTIPLRQGQEDKLV